MSVLSLLSRLKESGIKLQLVDDNLKINAPGEKLTPTLIRELKSKKEEITAFLRRKIHNRVKYSSIEPVEKKDYYTLSSAQKRMYILQQMSPGSISYNLPQVIPLGKEIDLQKLEDAFKELFVRHESLRTSFELVNEEPVQRVWSPAEIEFSTRYYRPEDSQGIRVEQVIDRFVQPFDISRAPLLRVGLLDMRTDGGEYILLLDIHHIVTDGTSQQILFKEFTALYNGEQLEPLKLQYKEYAEWRNREGVRESLKDQESYWLSRFTGEIPVLDLPGDFPRPDVQDFAGSELEFSLNPAETGALNELARLHGATLFMVLLGIYNVFLSKLTGGEDIVAGTPLAGRNHNDLHRIIGMFVNTLALRNFPSPGKTFKDFLGEIKDKTLEAFENQDYQFEDLVEMVSVERDLSRSPLFDVMFILQNMFDKDISEVLPEHHLWNDYKNRTSKFDLTLTAVEGARGLHFTFEYRTNLFKEETIERFIRYFKKIVSAVTVAPGQTISEIEIITDEEKKQALYEFNNTNADYVKGKTVHQIFEEQVAKTPDRLALVAPGLKPLTYSRLEEESRLLAQSLIQTGIKAGDIVAVKTKRSMEMIVDIFGILKAGGAYLPIDSAYPPDRSRFIMEDSGAKVLLDESNRMDTSHYEVNNVIKAGSADLAYVIYTSGTTGQPKGVMVEHSAVVNRLQWMQDAYPIGSGDTILQKTPIVFDVSVWELFWWSFTGASLCLLEVGGEKNPAAIIEAVNTCNVTTIHFVPSMLKVFMEYLESSGEIDKLTSLKQVFSSGEALSVHHVRQFNELFRSTPLINLYGPTEATVDVSYFNCPRDIDLRTVPIGKPIWNTRLYVVDRNMYLQPVGVAGELCIAGDCLARGYLNRPELTADKFYRSNRSYRSYFDTLYKTGDLTRWLSDGNIEFLGRIDHQVKLRGFRIELGEIESRLSNHPEVKQAVVTAREDQGGDTYLCAYIVTQGSLSPGETAAQLKQYLSQTLPEHMIPSYIIPMEQFPLTPNGKLDRKALPAPVLNETEESRHTYIAPRDEIEINLVTIWSDILGIQKERIGIDSNFFQLGGHSLKATILISRIHKQLHVRVPLAEVFKRSRIRQLAEYIRAAEPDIYRGIVPVEKKEYYPQSAAQKRLFFLDQFENIGTSYNMTAILSVRGKLEKERFEHTLKALLQRHESLRTSFHIIDNIPVQRIHPVVEFEVEYLEAGEEPDRMIEDFIRPFDLTRSPLLRTRLIQSASGSYLLLFDMHHIISDGSSMQVLSSEFTQIYAGEELAPLRIQYKEFSTWQNRRIEKGELFQQEDFWMSVYRDDIPKLDFPTDFPRPAVISFDGADHEFPLESTWTGQLRRTAADNGTTLYMILLAAFNVLLYKYTGQEDIVIGSSIMGRPHADLHHIIGMFVNSLAMRSYPGGAKTFRQLLEEVKSFCLQAFENQDMQFEDLVDRLKPERDPSRNPLFDVMLVVQNFEQASVEIEDVSFFPYQYGHVTAKFDFSLYTFEKDDHIDFQLEYAAKLFKPSTIARLASHFKNILRQVSENPGIRLEQVEILSEEEKQSLIDSLTRTDAGYPETKTIHELIEDRVDGTPDSIAVIKGDECITYHVLDREANRAAHYLEGTGSSSRIGLLMDKTVELTTFILGILKSGAAYIPINPAFPEERIREIILDASIGTVISMKKYIRVLNRLQWECGGFHTFICPDSENIRAEAEVEKSALMDQKLWEYVGESGTDEITSGGWLSSFTGEPIPKKEMDEYGDNILCKLTPLLHEQMRVLEIGCASGITMYRIAPQVGFYFGTDLSGVIIQKNKERIETEGLNNISLACLPAHEIDTISENNFDLVIMNSVIQHFHGHNYLRDVIRKVVDLVGEKAYLFIGDIMDLDRKEALIRDLVAFKKENRDKHYRTKTDWSAELFIPRAFFEDIRIELPEIQQAAFSEKIRTVENELTKFRYDVLLTIDKKQIEKPFPLEKRKRQHDLTLLRTFDCVRPAFHVPPTTPAYVIYTSGTTGRSRGVMIEHGNVVRLMVNHKFQFHFDSRDTWTMFHSYNFDFSVWEMYGALVYGGKLAVIPSELSRDTGEFLELLKRLQVTVLNQTPSAFYQLTHEELKYPRRELNLKYVIFGGEALTVGKLKEWKKLYPHTRLINMYGITETTVHVTYKEITDVEIASHQSNIGKPIPTLTAYVLDKALKPLPIGVPGELCVGGKGVGRGYLNNPELTAEKFVHIHLSSPGTACSSPLYRSGDLVKVLENHDIEYLGRIDHQVKIRGFRIELGEIECRLLKHDDIKEAFVIAGEDDSGDRFLCAYVVPTASKQLDISGLREFLSSQLPDYMIPSYIVQIEETPLTSNGKLDRKRLPDPRTAVPDGDHAAPRDALEEKIVDIWADVLGLEKGRIGIDDNFFELGGHSLKATLLITKIQKDLSLKLPLANVFLSPSIREMAKYLKQAPEYIYSFIELTEEKEYYPLSSAQKRMFILHQMDRRSTRFNMPMILQLDGPFDSLKVEEVFLRLIERHESFRMSFRMIDNKPAVKIHPYVTFRLEYTSLADLDSPAPGEKSADAIVRNFLRHFDLSEPPLLRAGLIKLAHEKYILMVDMHHIISDGTSIEIFEQEFKALYAGTQLHPLKIRYRDFSEWQNRLYSSGDFKSQEEYWINRFSDDIPELKMPIDFPGPVIFNADGASISFDIDRKTTALIKQFVLRTETTMFIMLLAVYTILLAKYSTGDDIVVGTPIAGRRFPDLENMIGLFINMLPLRNRPTGEKTFREFLEEVKTNALDAYENQDFQFDDLVLALNLKMDSGRNPIFSAVFVLQNEVVREIEVENPGALNQIDAVPYELQLEKVHHELLLNTNEIGNMLVMSLEYSTQLYTEGTVRKMITHFNEILEQVLDSNGDILIEDIAISHELIAASIDPDLEEEGDFRI